MQRVSRTIIITLAALLLVLGGVSLGTLGFARADALYQVTIDLVNTEFIYGQDFEINGIGLVDGKLYGNVVESNNSYTFVPSTQADGEYYINLNSLKARLNPQDETTTVSALSDGKVALIIPEGRKAVDYSLCGNGQSGNTMLYTPFDVYRKDDNTSGVYSVNKAGSVTTWTIKQRPVTVTLNNAEQLGAWDEEDITYIPHVYGTAALNFEFGADASSNSLMFGAYVNTGVIPGNDDVTHVGVYDIETPTTIYLNGADVTNCYKISTSHVYKLKILPATVNILAFEREDYYTAIVGRDGVSAVAFSEIYKVEDYLEERFVGQYAGAYIRVTFDVDPACNPFVPGREEEMIVDTSAEGHLFVIIGVECGTLEEDEFALGEHPDFTANLIDLPVEYRLRIVPTILTAYNPLYYQSSELPQDFDEGRWIAVNEEAMTVSYGRTYSESSFAMGQVEVEGHSLNLTGCIAGIDDYLAGNASVRLSVGSYAVSDLVVNDLHYSVVPDASALWVINPYVLTYADVYAFTNDRRDNYAAMYTLTEEESFGIFLEGLGTANGWPNLQGFVVGKSEYNLVTSNANQVTITLTITTGFDETVNLVFSTPGKPLPGYIEIANLAEQGKAKANYTIAPHTFFYKVNSLMYKVDATSVVYDGEAHPVPVLLAGGAFPEDPFANLGGGVTCSYQLKNANAQPINAGKYTVTVTARQPENWVSYNLPYYRLDGTSSRYEYIIEQCSITAYVNMITTSRSFGQSIGIGRICSVALRAPGNVDMPTRLAEVSCRATNSEELPGTYPVVVRIVDPNYVLNGDPISTKSDVKLECTVNPMTEEALKSALSAALVNATLDSLTVSGPTYMGIALDGYKVRYLADGDEDYEEAAGLTISGLDAGTQYTVQLYMQANASAKYLGSSKAVYGNSLTANTIMAKPAIEEDADKTTATKLAIAITNYDATNIYSVYLDDEELESTEYAINADGVLFINRLEPAGTYYVVVSALSGRVEGLEADSQELVAYTRQQAPSIEYGELRITDDSVKVPKGYMMFPVPYVGGGKVNHFAMSWQEALALPNSPLSDGVLSVAQGAGQDSNYAWEDLITGNDYLVLVWKDADPELGNLTGEVTVFWIKAETTLPAIWQGTMEYVAKYMLVGVTGLMAVLTIVLAIVFVVKRKKISRR